MINKTKTKILTLSVASVVGLAAITVLASNANNALDFQGGVKQNAHLELNELKLIENPTKQGVTSQTDVTWKMDDNELVATKEAKGTTNRVEGQWTLSIWGQSNSISESESFILWGKNNTLNAKTSIIGASNSIKGEEGAGDTVLGSSDVTFTWSNNIVQSANGTNIKGSGNIVLSTNQVNITTNNTMAIGNKAIVSGQGSFVFNGTTESLKSTQEFTTLISGNNGMIINTNKRNTPNVGLTVNWGIKVGQITNLDQQWSLITQDNCLQLKSTEKGAISLKCRGIERDVEEALKTPKCWRNAANYHYTDSRWKGAENSDFCAQGTFEGDKSFRSEKQRTTPTGIWSYADKGFTYDFTICFRDKDPLCAPKNLSKTWRCKTPEGNAVVCEANLQIKPMQCGANQHLEDEGQTNGTTAQGRKCLPNQKNVSCDDKGINKANGSFTNENVSVTRDANNRTYTTPSKCTLKCNEGFKLNEAKTACMSSTKQVSCDKTWTLPSNATWKDAIVTATRNSQKNSWDTPKCDFECKTGYYYDNNDGEPKCLKIPFSCEPWDNVTNATLVSTQEGIVGRDNKRNTLIWNWENPTTTCQYKCKTGYNLVVENWIKSCKEPKNGGCSSFKYRCSIGSVTQGTQKETDTHYTWECKWRYWGTPKQCTLSKSPQCTGNIPANASISQEQKTWFKGNKSITLVTSIDSNKKCQAVCNTGYKPNSEKTACTRIVPPACGKIVGACLPGKSSNIQTSGGEATWKCLGDWESTLSTTCRASCEVGKYREKDSKIWRHCVKKKLPSFQCKSRCRPKMSPIEKCDYRIISESDRSSTQLQDITKKISNEIKNEAYHCPRFDDDFGKCSGLFYMYRDWRSSKDKRFTSLWDFTTTLSPNLLRSPFRSSSVFVDRFNPKTFAFREGNNFVMNDISLKMEFTTNDTNRLAEGGTIYHTNGWYPGYRISNVWGDFYPVAACIYGARKQYNQDAQKCLSKDKKSCDSDNKCERSSWLNPPVYFWADRQANGTLDKTCRLYTSESAIDLKGTPIVDGKFCSDNSISCSAADNECYKKLQDMPLYQCVDGEWRVVDDKECITNKLPYMEKILPLVGEDGRLDDYDSNQLAEIEHRFIASLCDIRGEDNNKRESCYYNMKVKRRSEDLPDVSDYPGHLEIMEAVKAMNNYYQELSSSCEE